MGDSRDRVLDKLQRCRNGDDLLDIFSEALSVVGPVDHVAQLHRVGRLEPLAEPVLLHRGLRLEDHRGDGAVGDGRAVRTVGYDEAAVEALVQKHLAAEVVAKSMRCRQRGKLAIVVRH